MSSTGDAAERAQRSFLAFRKGLPAAIFLTLAQLASADSGRLTGDWGGARNTLENRGVAPFAEYVSGVWSNLRGGFDTGTRYEGLALWGADVDLEKLAGWERTSFHIDWFSYHGGQPSSDLIGSLGPNSVSEWEADDAVRFYNIYLRREFLDGALLVKAGQLAADDDFFLSSFADTLLNGAFDDFSSAREQQLAPFYPLAGPGVYLLARGSERWSARAGLYTADPGMEESSNIGLEWHLDEGVAFYGQLDLHLEPASMPGTYSIGMGITTARLRDFDGQDTDDAWSVHVLVDQALALNPQNDPAVGVFLRAGFSPTDDRVIVRRYLNVGVSVFGPIRRRDADILTAGVAYTDVSHAYVDSLRAAGEKVSGHETVIELSYRAAITDWLSLQADLQFFIDPHLGRRDALVFGLQAQITF